MLYEHDIVEKLRKAGPHISESGTAYGYILSYVDAHEAAEEIERLRNEVEWLNLMSNYWGIHNDSLIACIKNWWRIRRELKHQ